MNHEDPHLHLQADDDLYLEHSPSCRCSLCHPEEAGVVSYPPAVAPAQVWLVVEEDESEGTDWYRVLGVYDSKLAADNAADERRSDHGWNLDTGCYSAGEDEDDCWCLCHRKDWSIDGPFPIQA